MTFTKTAAPAGGTTAGITSPVSFAGVAIGSAAADRVVVLQISNVGAASSANALLSSTVPTINSGGGAVNMTLAAKANDGRFESAIYYLNVTTGTTATFSITITGGTGWSDGVVIAVGTLTGSATASVASTDVTTKYVAASPVASNTATVTVPTGGVAVCSSLQASSSASTWSGTSGVTVSDYDTAFTAGGSNYYNALAHANASGTIIETSTGGTVPNGFITAVFQP